MSTSLDGELRWILDTERSAIAEVHATLARELNGWPDKFPEDMTHDIHVCRFLRGHKHDADAAAKAMTGAIKYRTAFIAQNESVRTMRANLGDTLDLTLLPNNEEVLRCLPVRAVAKGLSAGSGLPLAIVPIRLVEPRLFSDMGDKLEFFIRCLLEARALVLHKLSLRQQRMVKFFEVRDFNNVHVSELILHGRHIIQNLKDIIRSLQDHYPEVLHQVLIAHAPTTFSKLFSLVSSVLNERMRNKIFVIPATAKFEQVACLLDANALHTWGQLVNNSSSGKAADGGWGGSTGVTVANMGCEFVTRWLEKGETLKWKVRLSSGESIRVFAYWMAEAPNSSSGGASGGGNGGNGGSGTMAPRAQAELLQDVALKAEEACDGSYTAEAASGVVWLCADNVASWWYEKVVHASLITIQPSSTPDEKVEAKVEALAEATAAVDLD